MEPMTLVSTNTTYWPELKHLTTQLIMHNTDIHFYKIIRCQVIFFWLFTGMWQVLFKMPPTLGTGMKRKCNEKQCLYRPGFLKLWSLVFMTM